MLYLQPVLHALAPNVDPNTKTEMNACISGETLPSLYDV